MDLMKESSDDPSLAVDDSLLAPSSLNLSDDNILNHNLKSILPSTLYGVANSIDSLKTATASARDSAPSNKEVTEVAANVPIYFLATNNDDITPETEFTVAVDQSASLHLAQQDLKDLSSGSHMFKGRDATVAAFSNDVEVPFTYYANISAQNSATVSAVDKIKLATNPNVTLQSDIIQDCTAPNELSEEMIRSFVVGGNIPSQKESRTAERTAKPSKQEAHMVTVITNEVEETQTYAGENNDKQQIIILTESDNEHYDIDNLLTESEPMQCPTMEFRDSSAGPTEITLDDFSNANDGKITVTLVADNPPTNPIHCQDGDIIYHSTDTQSYPETRLLTAEEILQRQPELHMDFQVEAEISSLDGVILSREITTQTQPLQKRKPSKRKSKDFSAEFEMLLANNAKRKRTGESAAELHKCPKCHIKLLDAETLEVHMKCHTTEKFYKCFECNFTHKQWIKMYNHLFSHGISKPFKCNMCPFSCVNKSDLTTHLFVHSTTKEWQCPKCQRSFKHRRNMVAHERTCQGLDESGKPKKAEAPEECICKICKKKLSNKRNLDKHLEIHMDVKPFVCDLCGHSTRLKESLIMHKRLHTGEKPFKCDQCDYSTPDKSSLRRHKRRHTNEKPYCCTQCDYKAIQKHCLETHIRRKHTGEQFVCGLCHYVTFDRYGLNQHFKQHQFETVNDEAGIVTSVMPLQINTSQDKTGENSQDNIIAASVQLNGASKLKQPTDVPTTWTVGVPLPTNPLKSGIEEVTYQQISTEAQETVQQTVEGLDAVVGALLQQIQEPGDLVFLQDGDIVIKKTDGRILIIQQQNEGDETENNAVVLQS
ncbi:uncharacterized protein LOC143452669 [Clavelina lepadiformis]|uniref:uncharacterized protein LOC143452669 n=1 Tax=Clavelina lepadiformis TaxID=159417 RepID=UPI00404281BF